MHYVMTQISHGLIAADQLMSVDAMGLDNCRHGRICSRPVREADWGGVWGGGGAMRAHMPLYRPKKCDRARAWFLQQDGCV